MTHILLTGAGFTHNWGAWLGSEAFEYLMGCRELDDAVRAELWADKNRGLGFEATLGRLQQQARTDARQMGRVQALTAALSGMFNMMDMGLKQQQFEATNDMRFQLGPFLARFDALFTLNQDLLLERHYFPGMELMNPRRWSGAHSPGIGAPAPAHTYSADLQVSAHRSPLPKDQFRVEGNIQPYFKLHGSSNWFADGEQMLVMGGNKHEAIGASALLRWYWERFNFHLCQGGTKLMVIGYGFGDPHVNAALIDAAGKGLKMFIVDPAGTDVLDRRGPNMHIKPLTDELMGTLQPTIIGASRRVLRATFGNDPVEYGRVIGFFDA